MSEADDSPNKSSSEVQYDDEGVFKVPVEKKSPLKAEEMVAKRTRSKISLTETPIETIQKKFIHTDLFPDMYALPEDMEGDEPWKEFLEQFQNPLGGFQCYFHGERNLISLSNSRRRQGEGG